MTRYIASSKDKPWSALIQVNPHAVRHIAYTAIKRLESGEVAARAPAISPVTGDRHYDFETPDRKTEEVERVLVARDGRLAHIFPPQARP